jgi:hypothetical protein
LTTVIACAFDHRTRMLPFIYADTRKAPGRLPVIAGGPKVIYEPWDVFGTDPKSPWGAGDASPDGVESQTAYVVDGKGGRNFR